MAETSAKGGKKHGKKDKNIQQTSIKKIKMVVSTIKKLIEIRTLTETTLYFCFVGNLPAQ